MIAKAQKTPITFNRDLRSTTFRIYHLNDEKSFDLLNEYIANIGHAISNQADMDLVYENFVNLLQHKMDDKLKQRCTNTHTSTKSTNQEITILVSTDTRALVQIM